MIYIDTPRKYDHKKKMYFHIIGETKHDLEQFANKLGLGPHWRQKSKKGIVHYDAPEEYFEQAKELGAILVKRKELIQIYRSK